MSAKTQRLLKKLPKNYVNFVGGYREELLSLQERFCHFSHEKIHISGSEYKNLEVAEHLHIHVLQHPTKFQAEIKKVAI